MRRKQRKNLDRVLVPILVTASLLSCRHDQATKTVESVPFDHVVQQVGSVALTTKPADSLADPIDVLVDGGTLMVLDLRAANVKMFRRSDGQPVGSMGRPGDGPGEFREPIGLVALDSGRVAVYDQRRSTLSIWSDSGALISESVTPPGFITGMFRLPSEQRLVLVGQLRGRNVDQDALLHEVDYGGHLLSSYAPAEKPHSQWEFKFRAAFGTPIAGSILLGNLATNRLRVVNRAQTRERGLVVGQGWYQPARFPSDRMLARGASAQTVGDMLRAWMTGHRMMSGIVPLTGGRFLARFQQLDSTSHRFFYYVLSDTTGRTLAATQPTRANITRSRGDTVFWVARDGAAPPMFDWGVVQPPALDSEARPAARVGAVHQ